MIGFFDYTVILTYLSLISASCGIMVALNGSGHPYIGTFFLLFCGLCDAFDGKVARTKKNRSQAERSFGVQIDSLSDLVAFGVLPAAIGSAMLRWSALMHLVYGTPLERPLEFGWMVILILYILAAMIRLAWYNVTEEERQKAEDGVRKYYTGLPVTSSALIFPVILLLQYVIPTDVTPVYFATAVICAIAFLSPFQIRKPGLRGVLILVGIGAAEFLLMLALVLARKFLLICRGQTRR